MTKHKDEEIVITKDGHICYVRINRPDHNNTLSFDFLEKFEHCLRQFAGDMQTRVVVICAQGQHFSFGADLNDVQAHMDADIPLLQRRRQMAQGAQLLKAIRDIPQVTICAIQGLCIGGGAAIASACDFRIGSEDCKIGYGEVKLGMNLMWQATPLCVQLIGPAKAKKMVMSGQVESASTLLRWGFLDEVCPNSALENRATSMAKTYAELPPMAVQSIKKSINVLSDALGVAIMHMDADQFLLLQNSQDAREGMAAQKEKRPGKFTGN